MTLKNLRAQVASQHIKKQQSRRAQSGYLMVSSMIALFVIGAIITLYVERQAERVRLERGEEVGYALATLGAGFTTYLDENYIELISDQPKISGFTDPLRPTAEQLIDRLNIRGVASKPPVIANSSYKFQVSFAQGCSAKQKQSGARCRPVGLAYIDKPLTRGTSGVDYVALARAARVMNGRGGYARPENSSAFTFPDSVAPAAKLPITNPTGVAGILAFRADPLSGNEERLKTNGSNRMKNTLRLDGDNNDNDLIGVKNIAASGSVTMSGQLEVRGGEPGVTWGLTVEKDAKVSGDLEVKGDFRVDNETRTDTLYFNRSHNSGETCTKKWSTGQDKDGNFVQCKNGTWQLSSRTSRDTVRLSRRNESNEYVTVNIDGDWVYCQLDPAYGGREEHMNYKYNLHRIYDDWNLRGWRITLPPRSFGATTEVWCSGRIPRVQSKDFGWKEETDALD